MHYIALQISHPSTPAVDHFGGAQLNEAVSAPSHRCSARIGWSVVIPELVTLAEMVYRPTLFDRAIVCGKLILGGNPLLLFHLLYTTCTARAAIYIFPTMYL
jgi:hypothetical protein